MRLYNVRTACVNVTWCIEKRKTTELCKTTTLDFLFISSSSVALRLWYFSLMALGTVW